MFRFTIPALLCALLANVQAGTPATPVLPVSDTYFGTTIVDPYRWMEDMQSEQWKTWLKTQSDYANDVLSAIPGRKDLQTRLFSLADATGNISDMQREGSLLFYRKTEPGKNGRALYMRDGFAGREKLLLDPDTLAEADTHYAIDFYRASPDGSYIAIGLSRGGSEDSELRILNTNSGKWLDERITRTRYSRDMNWLPDSAGFFYNRLPLPAEGEAGPGYSRSIALLHRLGQPVEQDQPLIGYGLNKNLTFDPADIPRIFTAPGSRYVIAEIKHGDSVARSYFIAPIGGLNGVNTAWQRIVTAQDGVYDAVLHADSLYLFSNADAPRGKLLMLSLSKPDLSQAHVVVAEQHGALRYGVGAGEALYLKVSDGGVDRLFKLGWPPATLDAGTGKKGKHRGKGHGKGKSRHSKPTSSSRETGFKEVVLPFKGTLGAISTTSGRDGALIRVEGWTESPRIYVLDTRGNAFDTRLIAPNPADFSPYQSERVMVKSHDGVDIPLSIIHSRSFSKDGSHPAILTGYGAYGISLEARFDPMRLAWLEKGGIMATCHLRGGGEYGEGWHRAGFIQTKANTAKDLIACAEYLVNAGYTRPSLLAAVGKSAGGIAVGGAMTARPDLFATVQSGVGLSDLLRMELTPNGIPNIAEFGTVKKESDFQAMLENSPYHRIKNGVAYPATIVTTGANDPRVAPWLPGKFAARLQAATASGKPVLLRVDYDAGHGMGSTKSQQVSETADVWSFFLWQMGATGFVPGQ